MNETRGNARTKPTNNNTKNYLPPNDIGLREPLKEREMNSLKDTEKTNNVFNYYDISWSTLNRCQERETSLFLYI